MKIKNIISIFLIIFVFSIAYAKEKEVVIYTSVDQIFSEPILKLYEKKAKVKVKALYDVEASKTVGLVNRLIAERDNPKADVFWSSEIARTIILKEKGILTPYKSKNAENILDLFKDPDGYWTGFAGRVRVLVYNKKLLKLKELPKSIFDLVNPKWNKKIAMAYPLLGTTATHMAALYTILKEENFKKFLINLKKNNIIIVSGNSVVKDIVACGEALIGFTDNDDVEVGIKMKEPIGMIYPDQDGIGTLLIPNTVALIKNSPHPEEGKKLIDFLLSEKVERMLISLGFAKIPLRKNVKIPLKVMRVNYHEIANNIKISDKLCQRFLIR